MSGQRGPPMYGDRRASGYNGPNSNEKTQRDREREDREAEAINYRDDKREWERSRNRDRDRDRDRGGSGWSRGERHRSRSPTRKYESYRSGRAESPKGHDTRVNLFSPLLTSPFSSDSSSVVSSLTNSPALSNRALNNNINLPSKPNFDLPPPPQATKAAEPTTLPDTLPLPPRTLQTPDSSTLDSLIASFLAFIDQASLTSALGVDRNTAKAVYEQRVHDFTKSSQHHEKFPTVKASQSDAKDIAKTRYLEIEQQMEEQKSKVNSMATNALEKLIPQVASMATSAKEKELREENQRVQQRCDSLERSLQELVQQVTTQAKYIKEIQTSKALEEVEERIEKGVRAEITRFTDKVEDVKSDLLASTNDMGILRKELDTAKASITKVESSIHGVLSLESEFKAEFEKTSKYMSEQKPQVQQNSDGLKALREQLKNEGSETKQEIAALRKDIEDMKNKPQPPAQKEPSNGMLMSLGNRITAAENYFRGLSGRLDKVEVDQQNDSTLEIYEQKLGVLEQSVLENKKAVEDRVAKQESSRDDFKVEIMAAVTKDLNKLKVRVDEFENLRNAASTYPTGNEDLASSQDDLKHPKVQTAQTGQNIRSAQTPRPSAALPVSSLAASSIPTDFLPKLPQMEIDLKAIRAEVENVKALQKSSLDAALDSMNDLIEKAMDDEVTGPLSEMKTTLKSYESLLGLSAKVQALENLNETLTTEIKELKRNLTADVTTNVLDTIRADPAIVSQNLLENRLTSLQAAFNNALTNTNNEVVNLQNSHSNVSIEVQALTNVTNNHETRINNVTTGQMTSYLLDQLRQTSPELQMVGALRKDFDLLRKRIDDLTSDTRTLFSFTTKNDVSLQKLEKDVTATKETSGTRITELIMGAEDLGKRVDDIQERLDNPKEPTKDFEAELNAVKKELTVLKDTQAHDLSSQIEALDNKFKEFKETHSDNLHTQLNAFKTRLTTLENVEPDDVGDRLKEIQDKLEQLSTAHEEIPGLKGEIATQQQQLVKFSEKLEKQSTSYDNFIEVTKVVEELKGDLAKIEGQFTTMQKHIETVEKQQKARPAHLNTAVNGVNGNRSSPNTPRSPVSAPKSRQDSVASATSESSRFHKAILPPIPPANRQASTSTPKPSTSAATTNGVKNRSTTVSGTANDMSKSRSTVDPNKSRSVRPDTHKPAEKPTGSDLNPIHKKRKHTQSTPSFSESKSSSTSGNARPVSKRVKKHGFYPDDDDDDEAANNFEEPKMSADDIESEDDCVITKVVNNIPGVVTAPPVEDQDFKRRFS